ncbi:MAG: hypothetical protein DMF71_08405 [Acidobacteria bacterium]|nr:MAG: hypothetical protein DMF71_08405 [Acidobacteriota bacterium]
MDSAIPASKSTVEIEQHLRQLNDEWVKALMRGDVETLSRIMADDFIFAYPLEGDDKAQFIADVTARELKVEHLSRAQVSVRVFGATAVLTARDSATWLYHGRELSGQYKIIQIYSERDGRWQLCALQACPIQ